MVCDRCIKAVRGIFESEQINPQSITLGKVHTEETVPLEKLNRIKSALEAEGFEWLDDRKVRQVEEIRGLIIQLVQKGALDDMNENLSAYLSAQLHRDYAQLSQLFSSIENTTIEQFFILQKIEKVKEWLVYDEFTLSEIAYRLGYSSVAHLSAQFKKVTGFTPSAFKALKDHHRKSLDKLR